MEIVVVTCIASPYQVELFDALASHVRLRAVYVASNDASRHWELPPLRHESLFLDHGDRAHRTFVEWINKADFVVFSDYQSSRVREAMARREAAVKPWCFWGERLGFRRYGLLGSIYRRVRLNTLHRSKAPIWGIGSWALESYQREFGHDRRYFNVPYFSSLERFCNTSARQASRPGIAGILYSGSLSARKGVDLLARAFHRLTSEISDVSLSIVGDGPLRRSMERELRPVSDKVAFHGFTQWEDLPRHYGSADILCVPSRYDGWGLVVPEGLASGLPVIATSAMGSAIDLIRPGINGWRIPPSDEEALLQALRDAVTMDSARWQEMSLAATRTAAGHSLAAGTIRFLDAVRGSLA